MATLMQIVPMPRLLAALSAADDKIARAAMEKHFSDFAGRTGTPEDLADDLLKKLKMSSDLTKNAVVIAAQAAGVADPSQASGESALLIAAVRARL